MVFAHVGYFVQAAGIGMTMSSFGPHAGSPFVKKNRVAIVAPALAPYRVPLLNRLNQLPNVEVTALLSYPQERQKGTANPQEWKFPSQVFRSLSFTYDTTLGDRAGVVWSPRLWTHLAQTPYELVISLGWTMPNTLAAWAQRKLAHKPIVVWEESIPHPPNPPKQILLPALNKYVGAFDGYLAASSWCRDYLVGMGAPRERVIVFPQVTDNDFFAWNATTWRARREELGRTFGITTPRVILFVGQFIVRKGIGTLFDAFELVAARNEAVSLVLVGQGALEGEMQERRACSLAPERIFIQNHVPQQELPKYYALADVFCLPSLYDTFGVVIDEAMSCGLPVVTTTRVGAVADLVRDGVNGRVVAPGDAAGLSEALAQILDDDALRERMGICARERMASWSVDTAAEALLQCIELCCPPGRAA